MERCDKLEEFWINRTGFFKSLVRIVQEAGLKNASLYFL